MKNHKQVSHVGLYVSDLSRTVSFYQKFLRLDPVKQKEKYVKFYLEEPGLVISFIEDPAKVHPAFGHLGFRVDSEDEVYARLRQAKYDELDVREEFGTKCCYALVNKFWVTDPDGYQWEVYNFIEDVEENDPKYGTDSEEECYRSTDGCCVEEPRC